MRWWRLKGHTTTPEVKGTTSTTPSRTTGTRRPALLRLRRTWEELDLPLYVQDPGEDGPYEATEAFFSYLFTFLTSPTPLS